LLPPGVFNVVTGGRDLGLWVTSHSEERRIAELLGSPVDLLPEPVEKRRLQDQINRDRRRAF
jgi:hypothetical protein